MPVCDKIIAGKYGKIAHVLAEYADSYYLVYRQADYTDQEWTGIANGKFRFTLEAKEAVDGLRE